MQINELFTINSIFLDFSIDENTTKHKMKKLLKIWVIVLIRYCFLANIFMGFHSWHKFQNLHTQVVFIIYLCDFHQWRYFSYSRNSNLDLAHETAITEFQWLIYCSLCKGGKHIANKQQLATCFRPSGDYYSLQEFLNFELSTSYSHTLAGYYF